VRAVKEPVTGDDGNFTFGEKPPTCYLQVQFIRPNGLAV
jgi:hypothetical protein